MTSGFKRLAMSLILAMAPGPARAQGTIAAWGGNYLGALGDGTSGINGTGGDRNTPVQVVGPDGVGTFDNIVAVTGGYLHSLALKGDGTVWAWGGDLSGPGYSELGTGERRRETPGQVRGPGGVDFLTNVVALSAGYDTSLALKTDGTVWAWGLNSNGQLGIGTAVPGSLYPVQVLGADGVQPLTGISAIASGFGHHLALKNGGTVWAWGFNDRGQLGDGTTVERHSPVQVAGLTNVVAVAAGMHSIALKNDGTVWDWGSNGFANPSAEEVHPTPHQVLTSPPPPLGFGYALDSVVAIASGVHHRLALRQDGTVWAWGSNVDGALGDGLVCSGPPPIPAGCFGVAGRNYAAQVINLADVSAIAGGGYHSLARKSGGAVWAWGMDGYGQLGNNAPPSLYGTPVPVQTVGVGGIGYLAHAAAIAGGGFHSFALIDVDLGQPPAITSANAATFTAGSLWSFTVTSTGSPTAALSEAGTLPTGVTFTDNGNGTARIGGTAAPASGGSYPIVITASSGAGTATQNFTLNVNASFLVDRSVALGANVVIGPGTWIKKGSQIGNNVVIGANVVINQNVVIGAGVRIGDNTLIDQGTVIGMNATIGANVRLGQAVHVAAGAVIPDATIVGAKTTVP